MMDDISSGQQQQQGQQQQTNDAIDAAAKKWLEPDLYNQYMADVKNNPYQRLKWQDTIRQMAVTRQEAGLTDANKLSLGIQDALQRKDYAAAAAMKEQLAASGQQTGTQYWEDPNTGQVSAYQVQGWIPLQEAVEYARSHGSSQGSLPAQQALQVSGARATASMQVSNETVWVPPDPATGRAGGWADIQVTGDQKADMVRHGAIFAGVAPASSGGAGGGGGGNTSQPPAGGGQGGQGSQGSIGPPGPPGQTAVSAPGTSATAPATSPGSSATPPSTTAPASSAAAPAPSGTGTAAPGGKYAHLYQQYGLLGPSTDPKVVDAALAQIEQRESGFTGNNFAAANIHSKLHEDSTGIGQISQATWTEYNHAIDPNTGKPYARAMDAPLEVQRDVERRLFHDRGELPWLGSNPTYKAMHAQQGPAQTAVAVPGSPPLTQPAVPDSSQKNVTLMPPPIAGQGGFLAQSFGGQAGGGITPQQTPPPPQTTAIVPPPPPTVTATAQPTGLISTTGATYQPIRMQHLPTDDADIKAADTDLANNRASLNASNQSIESAHLINQFLSGSAQGMGSDRLQLLSRFLTAAGWSPDAVNKLLNNDPAQREVLAKLQLTMATQIANQQSGGGHTGQGLVEDYQSFLPHPESTRGANAILNNLVDMNSLRVKDVLNEEGRFLADEKQRWANEGGKFHGLDGYTDANNVRQPSFQERMDKNFPMHDYEIAAEIATDPKVYKGTDPNHPYGWAAIKSQEQFNRVRAILERALPPGSVFYDRHGNAVPVLTGQ
jgi:hypothetical protein